jgi:transposase, IS5 family
VILSSSDWARLAGLVAPVPSEETGRPGYDALSIPKALYLQGLYDLSDTRLGEASLDRLSFRRFCGFSLDATTPDEATICRFRAAVAAASILQACFDEVNHQLEAKGVLLKKGTLMDASIVAARHNPPPREAGMGARHPGEPGADWTNKNGKSYFGYKLHVGVDEHSGIVRRSVFTSVRVADGVRRATDPRRRTGGLC